MKKMHEQATLGFRRIESVVAHPQESLFLLVHPFNPP